MLDDTIIAVATPPGIGGLGIVRLSGESALPIARRIFRPRRRIRGGIPVRRPVLGAILDPDRGGLVDEAFLTYFAAPHSYTKEDVVELSCHGSPVLLEEVVRLGVRQGARAARPGEFTLRAYANGRLDMLQAEAVNDLIRSTSLAQARISLRQLGGSLSRRVFRLREKLVHLAAEVEAGIEFPEEGLGLSASRHDRTLKALAAEVDRLVASYETGRALTEGITLAIVGRTNVGKSTLFNALLEEERAIVTPYPGTTRDYLREKVVIGDFVFNLVDMAGLARPSHPVENLGIRRGRKIARQADGLLIVLDGSRKANSEDESLIRGFKGKKAILVVNKADLPARLDLAKIKGLFAAGPSVEISALKGVHLDRLRDEIRRVFIPGQDLEEEIVLHARQKDILEGVRESLREARRLLSAGHSEEIYAEEIRRAVALMGRLTGEVRVDEVMDDVFGRFCVGK
jgi:tRNA modification GTPase